MTEHTTIGGPEAQPRRKGNGKAAPGVPGGAATPDPALLPFARLAGREIRLRCEADPAIDEARWMILLDIYLAMGDGRDTPFMSAAHASSAPVSSAQRYIHEMIDAGLIVQHRSETDQRITNVSLSEAGIAFVSQTLAGMVALRARG